jgi:hypothetical protein
MAVGIAVDLFSPNRLTITLPYRILAISLTINGLGADLRISIDRIYCRSDCSSSVVNL